MILRDGSQDMTDLTFIPIRGKISLGWLHYRRR